MEGENKMINVNEILHRLIAEFQSIEQVTAIAMAGSKFSNYQDDLSDININIYYTEFIPSETRNQILMKFSESMELDCPGEVQTDHCLLRDFPIELDLCYLDIEEIEKQLITVINEACVTRYNSTRIAYFVHYSNIVFDRHQQLSTLKQKYTSQYPDLLRQKIVQIQYPLLKSNSKSYYISFERALERRDRIHISSLLNDYLKSYLDLLFAINRQFYPIEKRIIQIMEESCPLIPNLMKEHIELLFIHAGRCDKQLLSVLDIMINQVTHLLNEQYLL